MARTSRTWLALALALAGCHGSANTTPPPPPDGGIFVDVEPDAGPPLRDPFVADTLGNFTGAYDVNGGGRLLVIQVDNRVAFQISDQQDLFIGTMDGGGFTSETVYPDQETCGPVTFDGSWDGFTTYQGVKSFCAGDQAVSGPLSGQRFKLPNLYKQELAWSGAYDATESPAASNNCALASGTHPLTIGVARDLDGGAVTAMLVGDGVKEQLVFGGVDVNTSILSANAYSTAGLPTDSFTLYFIADGGVAGTRTVALDNGSFSCTADLQFFGAKR